MIRTAAALTLGALSLSALDVYADTKFHRIAWDRDPSSNAIIGFSPDGDSQSPYVRYGFSTDENTWQQQDVARTHVFDRGLTNHFVYLNNLPANSPVYYRVCDQDGCGDRLWFKTAPNDNSPFVAIAGGDTRNGVLFEGHGVNFRDVGNTVLSQIRPLFVMHGGDYTNNNTDSEMIRYFQDWELTYSDDVIDGFDYQRVYPIVPTHGNHENGGGDNNYNTVCQIFGVDPNRDGQCNGADSYNAFNISPLLRVYTLNSELVDHADRMTAMSSWLKQDMEQNINAATWRFAQYHRPMFPHTDSKGDSPALYAYWATTFYDNAMNLVVESDTHLNKITRPLVPANNHYSAAPSGTVFTGEGSWGVPTRSADNPRPWTIDLDSFQQFKVITVRESGLELRTAQFGNSGDHNDLNTGITPLTAEQRAEDSTALPYGVNWWHAGGLGAIAENGDDNGVYVIRQNDLKQSVIGSTSDQLKRIDLMASEDVFIASGSTIFSRDRRRNFNGHSDGLLVDQNGSKGQTNTLIKWDLSVVPECATIESASIRLNLYNGSNDEFTVHQSQRGWNESEVTWSNLPRRRARGAELAVYTPKRDVPTGVRTQYDIPLNNTGVNLVRSWQQGNSNNGIIIDQSYGLNGMDFDSRETGEAPTLILLYNDNNCR